jgi:hypothetical protein
MDRARKPWVATAAQQLDRRRSPRRRPNRSSARQIRNVGERTRILEMWRASNSPRWPQRTAGGGSRTPTRMWGIRLKFEHELIAI